MYKHGNLKYSRLPSVMHTAPYARTRGVTRGVPRFGTALLGKWPMKAWSPILLSLFILGVLATIGLWRLLSKWGSMPAFNPMAQQVLKPCLLHAGTSVRTDSVAKARNAFAEKDLPPYTACLKTDAIYAGRRDVLLSGQERYVRSYNNP